MFDLFVAFNQVDLLVTYFLYRKREPTNNHHNLYTMGFLSDTQIAVSVHMNVCEVVLHMFTL